MGKAVSEYVSTHVAQLAAVAAGVALAGMVGYAMLSGSFALGLFDEMAWEKNVYENDRAFGSVSYKVGEVDESDNRIHDDEDDDEGANDSMSDALSSDDAATNDASASLAGGTVQTDDSARVGNDTAIVDDPNGTPGLGQGGQGNAGNGGADTPGGSGGSGEGNGPGGTGEGDNPGGPTHPPLTDEQKGQLAARDDYVDERYGTLVGLEVTVPENWSFAIGAGYDSSGVTVTAIYRQPDGTQVRVTIPYGDGGYAAFLSPAWDAGQHDATFTFGGISVSRPFTVMSKRLNVAFCSVSGGQEYPVEFPGRLLDGSMTRAAATIQEQAIPHSVVGGFFTDFSDAQRFMITALGSADVKKAFDDAKDAEDSGYKTVTFLDQLDAAPHDRLTSLVVGFRKTKPKDGTPPEDPLIYVPNVEDGQSTSSSIVAVVEPLDTDFEVVRVAGTKDNGYLGDQVLVGYQGEATSVEVPLGVTKVALTERNEKVEELILPESVLEVDFASLTEQFPNLKRIRVGDNNSQTFSSYSNTLYSANGLRVLYVPPCYRKNAEAPAKVMDFDAWSPYAEVVAASAFANGEYERVAVPSQIKELEAGCFAGAVIDELEFASETPVAGIAESGFAGDMYVPDTDYDTACKQWTAALGATSATRVGVRGDASESGSGSAGVEPGTYAYDAKRDVVVRAADLTVLALVPASAPKAYRVPDDITAIDAGAFAATPNMRDIVMPASLRQLRANSLVGLGGGAHVTLSGTDVVSIDAAAFGDGALDAGAVPDIAFAVPRELHEAYLRTWGAVLGDEVARELLEPADETYLYLDNAKYLVLDGAGAKLRLAEVFDEGQTFFEPDARTTEIADGAFSNCASLEIVHVPASVTSVGAGAFDGCAKLETVLVSGKLPELPDAGSAQLLQPGSGVGYDYESDTGVIYRTDANGALTLVNVPTDTTAITVRANTAHLGDEAFAGCSALDGVIGFETPETLVSVGVRCFADCLAIEQASFAEFTALASLGDEAFAGCTALKTVALPDSVSQLGQGAFATCSSLASFTAYGLTALSARTFSHCTALSFIDAPNVTSVGDECFYHCESLRTLKGAVKRPVSDGGSEPGDVLNLDELTWVGDRAFAYCLSFGFDEHRILDLPAVEHVGAQAFMGCPSLCEVVLPASLTELGEEAFRDCMALDTLHAQGSLETIGRYCFYGCVSLAHLDVSDSQKQALEVLGACAFARCVALERLDVSDYPNLSYLGSRAFEGCEGLLRITLPAALTEVSDRCFADCPELSIIELAAENPTALGSSVLGSEPPAYLTIWVPNEQAYAAYLDAYSATLDAEYGEGYARSVLEVRSDNVEKLRGITYEATDEGWVITDAMPNVSGTVMIADSVAAIAPEAFAGCDEIEKIQYEFSASISLGDRAFAGCSGLKEVQLNGTIPSWGESVFEGCESLEFVRVGGSSANGDYVASVGPRAFADCTALDTLYFYTEVGTIDEEAFCGCTSLGQIGVTSAFRDNLQVIGDRAFMGAGLKTFPFSSKYRALKSIGDRAFYDCDSLTGSTVPANVTSLGEACFANCDNLKTASIYGGLAEIPKDCFKGCKKLLRTGGTAAAFAGLKVIGESAFEGCTSLELTGPNEGGTGAWSLDKYTNLEYIGANAFKGAITHAQAGSGNPRLDAVTLASTLSYIGAHAFDGCIGLAKVTLQSSPEMGEGAFANMRDGFVLEQPGATSPASDTGAAEAVAASAAPASDGADAEASSAAAPAADNAAADSAGEADGSGAGGNADGTSASSDPEDVGSSGGRADSGGAGDGAGDAAAERFADAAGNNAARSFTAPSSEGETA